MAAFGTLTLLIALVMATYAGVASLIGARRGSTRLIESGRMAAYGLAAVLGLSSITLIYAFVTHDYSIRYVQQHSDAASPLFYLITAYWGGLDGSILWWVFLLSVFGATAIHFNRHRHKEIMPYTVAVLMVIADFFLLVIVFHKNPFDTFLVKAPTTGEGLNPLLQNAYMITHPPSLYTGFVGMSIPYAFAMGALISGHLDDAWIGAVRRWTLIAWFFLSMGLTLGMLWAYEELGWGGFWAWDPVENAGFLPWLTGTAFLHSVTIQERRGMMKIWNFTLVILTFILTIIGTALTRTGIVQSVHAFGQDTKMAYMFLSFLLLAIVVSFGFMIARVPELRARGRLDSWLSREAAFLVNNWILLFSAFFVLFATLFPTISEAVTGTRITVGPPFFNQWMIPIGLVLLFLTGVGPLIAWRRATASHLRYQFTWPVIACLVTVAVCLATGLRSEWAPVVCFGLCAFVFTTITQEFARGAAVRKRNTGSDTGTALLGMVLRGRRRYGGYVVHVGIVLMFFGFAGQAYKKDQELNMTPGQSVAFGRYQIRFDRLLHEEDRQKEMLTAEMIISQNGKVIDHMRPAKWFFVGHPEGTTEVALRRAPAEDLYITLGNWSFSDGSVTLKLVVNPLVDWIWVGFMMLALGTGIALLPDSVVAPLAVKAGVPAAAAARGAALLFLIGLGLFASGTAQAATADQVQSDIRWLETHIMCMCSCRKTIADCDMPSCSQHGPMRNQLRSMIENGQSRDDVIRAFTAQFKGEDFLLMPVDRGFNRLAWGVPYAIGLAGAGGLAYGAWRLSKRIPKVEPRRPSGTADPGLEDRLEDELARID